MEGDRAVAFDPGWKCGCMVVKKIFRGFGWIKCSDVAFQNFVGGAIWGLDSIMGILRRGEVQDYTRGRYKIMLEEDGVS